MPFMVAMAVLNMCGGAAQIHGVLERVDQHNIPMEYDNRPDFTADDTYMNLDPEEERNQMLNSKDENELDQSAEPGDRSELEPEERDDLRNFLHQQRTHGRRNTVACAATLVLLWFVSRVGDTPHNYLAQDEAAAEGIPGLDPDNLECNDPCIFPHVCHSSVLLDHTLACFTWLHT